MRTSLFFLAALAVVLASPEVLPATNFSAEVIRQTIDGPNPRHYFFRNDDRKIIFRIDPATRIAGQGGSAEFTFSDVPGASLKIAASPMKPADAFDKDPNPYEAAARASLPAGSTEIVLTGQTPDAYPINGWKSLQFSYTYNFFGKAFRCSTTFLNYNDREQWIITMTSDDVSFESISGRVSKILNSIDDRPLDYQPEAAPS